MPVPFEDVMELDEPPFAPDAATMHVDYVGIRQGDCIVIRVGGQTMLIDGGEGWRYPNVKKYLKENNIDHFDVMFLTHAHDDHIEVQDKLIRDGFSVGKVISPYTEEHRYELWRPFVRLLKERGIPFETYRHGDSMEFGGATLHFFRNDNTDATMNNRSLMAMLEYGDARVLLMADAEGEAQHLLADNVDPEMLRCDIYKAGHHGRTAIISDLLEAADPGLAIVTNARHLTGTFDNQMNRLDIPRYYITYGTICTETDGSQWYVWVESLE